MRIAATQRGISLVELMVALLISSFLILGVTELYLNDRKAYAFQLSQIENQQGSRFIQAFLQTELSKAGYRRRPELDAVHDPAYAAESFCGLAAGQTLKFVSSTALCLRYQPRGPDEHDCLNTLKNTGDYAKPYTAAQLSDVIVERIELSGNELVCSTPAGKQALMGDVADLYFEQGLGDVSEPNRLLEFASVDRGAQSLPVMIRFNLLLRAEQGQVRDGLSVDDALAAWKARATSGAAKLTSIRESDRGQLYQISQGTISLRNLLP